MTTRRSFLQQTAALAAGAALPFRAADAKPSPLIDCNVTLGRWPFRFTISEVPQVFCQQLRDKGATRAIVGTFDGIFYRSTALNDLFELCLAFGPDLLMPAGPINLTLPDWQNDFDQLSGTYAMKIVRLHPNYHGYTLDDPDFLELLELAAEKKILIQIAAQMEDERTQHPAMQVPPVDLRPLPDALQRVPQARLMVLNANRAMSMRSLQGTSVILDIAMLEGVGGIENLLKEWPLEQLVFGSHAPLFYFESAKLKLQESELTEKQLAAITHENAQRLLAA